MLVTDKRGSAVTDARYRTRPFAVPEGKTEAPRHAQPEDKPVDPVYWTAHVTFDKVREMPSDEQVDMVMEDSATTLSYNGNLDTLEITWFQQEGSEPVSLADFSASAIGHATGLLAKAAITFGDAIHVDVRDDNRPHETSELYRYADFAFFGNVSRQAVAQAAKTDPDFPRPMMHLSDGTPLYHPLRAIEYAQKRWPSDNDVDTGQ